uniref:Uncharacterized protein n=1 Tax=viral metagenome TaxID=1070528 RepID=A0A6C0JES2_9ZZZZ
MTNNDWSDEENAPTLNPPEEIPFYYADRYLYDGVWYHLKFPENWAKNHSCMTGPHDCANCAYFGSVNGVFLGYCCNCADYNYKGARGRGFIDIGIELNDETVIEYNSAFDTYLQGVDVSAIRSIEEITTNDIYLDNQEENDIVNEYDENLENYNDFDDNTNSILYCHFEGGYNDF